MASNRNVATEEDDQSAARCSAVTATASPARMIGVAMCAVSRAEVEHDCGNEVGHQSRCRGDTGDVPPRSDDERCGSGGE